MNEIKIEYGSIYRRVDGEDAQVFCPFAPGCDMNQERHEETMWCTTDCAAFRLTSIVLKDDPKKGKQLAALCQRLHGKQIIGVLKRTSDDKR